MVLASGSPRRAQLLRGLGLEFEIRPAELDEPACVATFGDVDPPEMVSRLALTKARAVAAARPDAVVVGADTVVVLQGQVLGKPADEAEAESTLARLSGRTHVVLSGLAVVGPDARTYNDCARTHVTFRPLTTDMIQRYVASGEPMDKAGAYGIQALGAVLVERIEGDYFNVVGLPIARLSQALEPYGYRLP